MKIAISTDQGMVYPHFGRAPEFTFIDIENNEVINTEIVPNPGHTIGSIPKLVNDHGAQYMISGGMGRRAIDFFDQYGIEVIVGVEGTVKQVIEKILNGQIKSLGGQSLCAPGHAKGVGVEKIHTEEDDTHPHHH